VTPRRPGVPEVHLSVDEGAAIGPIAVVYPLQPSIRVRPLVRIGTVPGPSQVVDPFRPIRRVVVVPVVPDLDKVFDGC